MAASDAKTLLNTFCQRFTKKCISKADIIYETNKIGDQYQSTVTLICIEGAQFAGELACSAKEAEQNAAAIAMSNYANEAANLPPANNTNKKRKATAAPGDATATITPLAAGPAPLNAGAASNINNRLMLNQALMKILKRPLQKEDMSKSIEKTELGYQCTISLLGLPSEWSGLAWAGEVAQQEKDAVENAATYALQALQADPTFAGVLAQVKPPAAKKPKTAGKGMGGMQGMQGIQGMQGMQGMAGGELSGAMADGWGQWQWGKGFGKFGKGCKGKGKGKGKGKDGKTGGGPKPREQVSTIPVTGTIVEWKGKFGWVQLSDPVQHPDSAKNGGKIFLHIGDWQDTTKQPAAGQTLMCTLYLDRSGLGADNAMPL